MTALDQILIGIEKLPISDFRKTEYMLNLMYVHTDDDGSSYLRGLNVKSKGNPYDDLVSAFWFDETEKGDLYWISLYNRLVKNNWE